MRVGADSGGTFTDVVTDDGRIIKVISTSLDPGEAVRSGLDHLDASHPEVLAHGTTIATNALLQRRVARVALLSTAGFADVIEIARQDRPSLYDPWIDRPEALVARADRLEVVERLAADASVVVAYRPGSAPRPAEGVEGVAIALLHSDLDPRHEQAVAAELAEAGFDVTASHQVSPEFREYERTVTTVINAALRPVCSSYLRGLGDVAGEVAVMTSVGALVGVDRAAEVPAALLLSGPAAGARAAAQVASACGFPDAIGFDMGGTSTDVCLILDGEPAVAAQQVVAGFPVRLPSLDVHTVGAGGGSIARIDSGGALVVGPGSAGADPGPVCYSRGGAEPTVTDANLLLGRIPSDSGFSGIGTLDAMAAAEAMQARGITPEGVLAVVNETMVQALRKVSVQRGVDPAEVALVAFGGAGPLHACELAEELGAAAVVIPAAAGVLSAVGLLTSPRGVELVRSRPTPLEHDGLDAAVLELARQATELLHLPGLPNASEVTAQVRCESWLDCRYVGQSHELRVASVQEFHREHRRLNGYDRPADPVEVTAVRVVATLPEPVSMVRLGAGWVGAWDGEVVTGPRVVARDDCTIWVPEGWVGHEGALGALVLHRTEPRT